MRKNQWIAGLVVILLLGGCASAGAPSARIVPNTSGAQQGSGQVDISTAAPTLAPIPTNSPVPLSTETSTPAPTATLAPARGLPFSVTEVETSGALSGFNYSGLSCQASYTFTANISTTGAGTVTYHWQRSNGTRTTEASLTFTGSEFQTVKDYWTILSTTPSISGTDQVVIDQPAHQAFTPAGVNFYCAPPPAPTKGPATSKPLRKP